MYLLISALLFTSALSQADGNPHNWDRRRRCDLFDYNPPCGLCEGYGGIPYGDDNDDIHLTTCTPVAKKEDIDPATLKAPVWATEWYTPEYYSVLIGPKLDPFCFKTFPSNSSIGDMCYVAEQGTQAYDMNSVYALRYDVEIATGLGNVTSTVLHQGRNMWIINQFPWYAFGVHQCICTVPKQGSDAATGDVYPLAYNWTDNLIYMGREKIDVEYVWLKQVTLDHWAYGPHHIWSYPDTGSIIRMWQPFNGLQVFPIGTNPSPVNPNQWDDIPPALCKKKGGATFRIKCTDDGYPDQSKDEDLAGKDLDRAKTPIPGHDFRGENFFDMSVTLNSWIKNSKVLVKECSEWSVEELQQLQKIIYAARHEHFNHIYEARKDNREIKSMTHWEDLNNIARKTDLVHVQRDGHCHEAVMWFVHHLTQDMKDYFSEAGMYIPLLAYENHQCPEGASSDEQQVYDAYQQQVTCADCHSDWKPPTLVQ